MTFTNRDALITGVFLIVANTLGIIALIIIHAVRRTSSTTTVTPTPTPNTDVTTTFDWKSPDSSSPSKYVDMSANTGLTSYELKILNSTSKWTYNVTTKELYYPSGNSNICLFQSIENMEARGRLVTTSCQGVELEFNTSNSTFFVYATNYGTYLTYNQPTSKFLWSSTKPSTGFSYENKK